MQLKSLSPSRAIVHSWSFQTCWLVSLWDIWPRVWWWFPASCIRKKKNVFWGFLITGFSVSDSNLLIPGRRPWSKQRRLWPWRKAVASWPCLGRRAGPERRLQPHAILRTTWRTFQRDLIYANGNDWPPPSARCNLEITKRLEKDKNPMKEKKTI